MEVVAGSGTARRWGKREIGGSGGERDSQEVGQEGDWR